MDEISEGFRCLKWCQVHAFVYNIINAYVWEHSKKHKSEITIVLCLNSKITEEHIHYQIKLLLTSIILYYQ